jgi:hypothetical protein
MLTRAAAAPAAGTAIVPPAVEQYPELGGGGLVRMLTREALAAVASATPESLACGGGYLLALEAVQLLLALSSTQLYSASAAAPPGAHPYLEAAMQVGAEVA